MTVVVFFFHRTHITRKTAERNRSIFGYHKTKDEQDRPENGGGIPLTPVAGIQYCPAVIAS